MGLESSRLGRCRNRVGTVGESGSCRAGGGKVVWEGEKQNQHIITILSSHLFATLRKHFENLL